MTKWIFFIIIEVMFPACQGLAKKPPAQTCPAWNEASLIYASQSTAQLAHNSTSHRKKKAYARKALDWAEKCVASFPQSVGCSTALSDARIILSSSK